jgi:hypothetical protein
LQDDYRSTRLVVRRIEPVAKVEGRIAVRLVASLVVKVVHRYGEVVCRVELARVDVFSLEQGCALTLWKRSARCAGKYSDLASYLANEVLDGSSSAADAQVDGCRAEGKPAEQKALYA